MSKILPVDVIIPVWNEHDNIIKTFALFNKYVEPLCETLVDIRIFIVYDFDEDTTLPVIEKLRKQYSYEIICVKNEKKGACNALKKGFEVIERPFVLVTMGDASDDYRNIEQIFQLARQGYDIVCPSRYTRGGKIINGPFPKQILSRIANVTLHLLTGIPTVDLTNDYKLYTKKILDSITIESKSGFEVGMEIVSKSYINGAKIIEVPTCWWNRTEGKSRFELLRWIPAYLKWYGYLLFTRKKKRKK